MQEQEELKRIALRFLDEVERKLSSAKSCYGMRKEIEVPIHPEIYTEAIAALEIINQLGQSRGVRVEQVEDAKDYRLKYISLEKQSEQGPNQSI